MVTASRWALTRGSCLRASANVAPSARAASPMARPSPSMTASELIMPLDRARLARIRAAAIDRSQSMFTGFGAKLILAESAITADIVGLIIEDPAAAERYARGMRPSGPWASAIMSLIWPPCSRPRCMGRAASMRRSCLSTKPLENRSSATVFSPWLTEAKLLARRGQFAVARKLVDQAEALQSPTSASMTRADVLRTRAEVERLAKAPGQAAADLRAVLDIYEQQRATTLASQVRSRPGRPAWRRPGIAGRLAASTGFQSAFNILS